MRSASFISLASLAAPIIFAALAACTSNAQTPNSAVSAVTVSPNPCGVAHASSQQMSAQATLADGSKEDITTNATWTSSNTSVATVDSSGNVVGVSGGTVTITAAFDGANGTAGCIIAP
jgi:trimeric autotransporter adhesin